MTINILPDVSKSKDNQKMKFGQLIECNVKDIFLRKSCRHEVGKLVPNFFLFIREALYEVKASG